MGSPFYLECACDALRGYASSALRPLSFDALSFDPQRFAPGAILLLGALTSDGRSSRYALRAIRRLRNDIVAVLLVRPADAGSIQLPLWSRAGLDEMLPVGSIADVEAIARWIKHRCRVPTPSRELTRLVALQPESFARGVVSYVWRNAHLRLSPAKLARLFGCSERTLRHSLHDATYPPPREVCRLGILAGLAELEDNGIRDRTTQCATLGWKDVTQLQKWRWQLRNSVHANPDLSRFLSAFERLQRTLNSRTSMERCYFEE